MDARSQVTQDHRQRTNVDLVRFYLTLLVILFSLNTSGQSLSISVLDAQGKPFAGAVVELLHPDISPSHEPPQAAMDQVDKQFAPYLLVVEQGSAVAFPNSDSIKHHVFSFSAAKRFQLKLYKDREPAPLVFDKPGIVALGCNIHDWMVGYIYVARSGLYLQSDEKGLTHFDVTPRPYQVRVWHPRFHRIDSERRISLAPNTHRMTFTLTKPLHPILDDQADEFESY